MAIEYVSYDPEESEHISPTHGDPEAVISSLFRSNYGQMVSSLTKNFGAKYLMLSERIVHEAFLSSQDRWLKKGIPKDPPLSVWKIVRSKAVEILHNESELDYQKYKIMVEKNGEWSAPRFFVIEKKRADLVNMLFGCCWSKIPSNSRKALVLSLLCGLSTQEVRSALSNSNLNLASALSSSKSLIESNEEVFEIPGITTLNLRLSTILNDLFELYKLIVSSTNLENDLFHSTTSNLIKLTKALSEATNCDTPNTHALLSYMLLVQSRTLVSRTLVSRDSGGSLVPIEFQDRSKWSAKLINQGIRFLHKSAEGREVSEFHLEASIEACHSIADDYYSTDWEKILSLYDSYTTFCSKPEIAFRHALVLARVEGPLSGIKALEKINNLDSLGSDQNPYDLLGELYIKLGEHKGAMINFERAREMAGDEREKEELDNKIERCKQKIKITNKYHLARSF